MGYCFLGVYCVASSRWSVDAKCQLGGGWKYFVVPPLGRSGGLWMLWDPALNVDVLFHDQWIIHLQINEDSSTWFLSGIYGNAKASVRKYQWQTLPLIAPPNLLWLCMGDFNDILYREEKSGGNPVGNQESKHFMEMVNICGLIDLGFNDPIYTWCNNQQGRNRVFKRIDRFLANAQWRVLHPNAKVFHKPNLESNHKILLLHLNSAQSKLRSPFRFEVMWLSDPTCKSVIHNAMNNHVEQPQNCTLDRVADFIEPVTRTWNAELVNTWWPPEYAHKILSTPLALEFHDDELIWEANKYVGTHGGRCMKLNRVVIEVDSKALFQMITSTASHCPVEVSVLLKDLAQIPTTTLS
ncbi:hypothetical protein IFM89_017667 [Coptis chinensis]|uniref:Uncharacterized protein n=1 Tax=Coptis chinensis TaxID=261450 RepID=A0A835H1G2_9MAGN|nr:hypothetical protein IFM89_017667 [Coptis chinensis]